MHAIRFIAEQFVYQSMLASGLAAIWDICFTIADHLCTAIGL